MMKLYGHPFSSHARRVQMFCEELGVPYDYQVVDLFNKKQHAAEFLAMNPNGKVPVIDDDGFVLWESHAILRYLADKHGAHSWYPVDIKARSQVERWLDWNHTRLGPEVGKIAFNTLVLREKGNAQAIEDGKKWLLIILPVLDGELGKRRYVCGNDITIADLATVTSLAYLEKCQYSLADYPAIAKWYEAMKQRPSFAATAMQS